ncbi:MAG: DUF615 domain-containing protein [Pseudomonadales bacterium]|nr:DUF615 domain-containing protein [Pseudomonadales bacterium]
MYDDDDDVNEHLSKTQVKQDMDRLQSLGEFLLKLKPAVRSKLPLTDSLDAALDEDARIRAPEARRRHRQYIGKLMRQQDEDALLTALESVLPRQGKNISLEMTLQRLLTEGDKAVAETVQRHPGADRPRLRQLVRMALRDLEKDPEATEGRHRIELYLRELAILAR